MPGGGGLQAANYIYNAAPHDGTTIEVLYDGMPSEQALGLDKQLTFDARRFSVLGSVNKGELGLVSILKRAGVNSVDDAKHKTVVLAATGTASAQYVIPTAMNRLIATKFKIIPGYKTVMDSFLAMETGEVDGLFASYETLTQSRPEWIRDGKFRYIAQTGETRNSAFPTVPLLQELVDDPVRKQTFRFLSLSRLAGKLIIAPPGVPDAQLSELREALARTLSDPLVIGQLAKIDQSVEPRNAVEAARIISETIDTDPTVLAQLRASMSVEH